MDRQKRVIRRARQMKIILTAYLMLGLLFISSQGTQAQAGVIATTPYIIVRDQAIVDNHVSVAQVFAPQDGWLVVHRDVAHNPREAIGLAAVRKGLNTNVMIPINATPINATPTGVILYLLLHADEGELGVYEFPGPDAPIILSNPPMIPFRITGLTTTTGTAAKPESLKSSAAVLSI